MISVRIVRLQKLWLRAIRTAQAIPPTLTVLLLLVPFCGRPAHASLLVSPARIEVEVGPGGATETLTIVNRGEESILAIVYAGGAEQRPDGSIAYLDGDAHRRRSGEFVAIEPATFEVAPRSHAAVPVHFRSMGQRVSFYPVIFVEFAIPRTAATSHAQSLRRSEPVQTITRIAVPVLMTNAVMLREQSFRPVLVDLDVTAIPGTRELEVSLLVENAGNVHGEVAGEVLVFDPADRLIERLPVRAGRLLPGSARVVSVRWPAPRSRGEARIVATLVSDQTDEPVLDSVSQMNAVFWDEAGDSLSVSVIPVPALATGAPGRMPPVNLALGEPEGE